MGICDDGDVVVVRPAECGESARRYVTWRVATAVAALVPVRCAYVRRVAGVAAGRVLEQHGSVLACVDAETRDVVLGVVAAYDRTIAALVVRTRYRGLGVGDALVDAAGAEWSVRELRDVGDDARRRVRVIGSADSLWEWCDGNEYERMVG